MTRRFDHVAVLMGGWSAEREVSLVSGAGCAAALREAGYRVTEIDVGRDVAARLADVQPDACFNALHGRWGEDGCMQGLLEVMGIPYTHSGVLASALAMDKARARDAFAACGLTVAEGLVATAREAAAAHLMAAPYVVKPVNEGSSVGVHIVRDGANRPPQEILGDDPDRDVLVEAFVPGRELTVSVMDGRALAVTDILPATEFYDYKAKYAAGGSRHVVPAEIPEDVYAAALSVSEQAHRALGCRGVSRADFRWNEGGTGDPAQDLVLLEVNTQPGMTPTSLVPEQAAHAGLSYRDLVVWMMEDASCPR